MDNNIYSNININTFNHYSDALSDEDIIQMLNKIENVENINMEIHKLNMIIYKLDIDIFKKILLNLKISDLLYIYKNCINEKYLKSNFNFWDNNKCFDDFIETVKTLNNYNLLYLVNEMNDVKFKMNISSLKFYQIRLIYPYIKENNIKFKILINGIEEEYLMYLINEFDDKAIQFLNLNYNFIFRFNQISIFATTDISEINEINISKLQIILLLGTSNESKIKVKILDYEFMFIKKIINHLNSNTFIYIIKNLQLNMIYELIDIMNHNHLVTLLGHINDELLHIMCLKLSVDKLCKLIEYFTLDQFISNLYYITDDKIECLKYINTNHKIYIEHLFNLINSSLYEEYLTNFSKQIIFCLLQTNYKNIILQKCKSININIIKIIINFFNYNYIITILNNYNIENRTSIITSIYDTNHSMISNYIDDLLFKTSIVDLTVNNKINFNLFYNFINLHLSSESNNKIKKILNIDNV